MLSASMRLREFFFAHYVPVVMENPSPAAEAKYLYALDRWEKSTGNPPLRDITPSHLAQFKKYLRDQGLATNTVRSYLQHVQWILDHAGPAAAVNRLRNAAGLIERVPWTKPPRREKHQRPLTEAERVIAIYRAGEHARFPQIDGITPAAWWRALISTMASTSLRIGQLVRVPYSAVVWDPARPVLLLSAEVCRKSKSDEVHPLHATAFRDLLAIWGQRELLFPAWPEPHHKTTIYREFHRLERLAGYQPQPGLAFHGIRRRVLTDLAEISPAAAQMAAGHESFRTTIQHYLGVELLARAIKQLPLAEALASD